MAKYFLGFHLEIFGEKVQPDLGVFACFRFQPGPSQKPEAPRPPWFPHPGHPGGGGGQPVYSPPQPSAFFQPAGISLIPPACLRKKGECQNLVLLQQNCSSISPLQRMTSKVRSFCVWNQVSCLESASGGVYLCQTLRCSGPHFFFKGV